MQIRSTRISISVVTFVIVACGHELFCNLDRNLALGAMQRVADEEHSPTSPARPVDGSDADDPADDDPSAVPTESDEPAYRGVPLSTHLHELSRGEYDNSDFYPHVYDRPKHAEPAFRHFGAKAAEPLARALKDKSLVVRWNAVEALKVIGTEARVAIGALTAVAFEDPEVNLRREAVIALGKIGPDAAFAIADLAKMLRDTERHDFPPHGFWRFSDAARDALVEIGPDALPVLVAAMNDDDPTVRLISAEALGRFPTGADIVVPALRKMLKDKESGVRAMAAKALGRLGAGARAAAPDLATLLNDDGKYGIGVLYSGNVAAEASQALSRVGPTPSELSALISAVEHNPQESGNDGTGKPLKDWVSWYAAQSLGQLGAAAKPAVTALDRSLKDSRLRCTAAVALMQIDPARTDLQRHLEKCLLDDDVDSRICALRAFRSHITPDESSLRALRRVAREENGISSILAAALILRAAPGDVDMIQALSELLRNRSDDVWHPYEYQVERWGDDFLEVFATCPEAADAGLRTTLNGLRDSWTSKWALEVLARIGARAVPAIEELSKLLDQEQDTEARRVTVSALGRIGPGARKTVPALVRKLRDPRAVVRAAAAESLGRIGDSDDSVVAGLEGCLADDFLVVRKNAVLALGKMQAGARNALPRIDLMKNDPSPSLRRLAAEAIRNIRGEN
jgi:HEAT repeat protein